MGYCPHDPTTSTCNFSYLFVYLSPSLKTPLYTGVSVWQQMCDRWQINPCFQSFPSCPTLVHDATFNCHYRYCQQALEAQTVCFVGSEQLVSSVWNGLFGASAQLVRRHCDTCSEALWHLFRGSVAAVQHQCSPHATAMFTPCNGIVHPVQRQCSPRATIWFTQWNGIVHCYEMHLLVLCGGTEKSAQKCCENAVFRFYLSFVTHLLPHGNAFIQRHFQWWWQINK